MPRQVAGSRAVDFGQSPPPPVASHFAGKNFPYRGKFPINAANRCMNSLLHRLSFLLLLLSVTAGAQLPQLINYEGRVAAEEHVTWVLTK